MATEARVTAVIDAKDNASGVLGSVGSSFASLGLKVIGIGAALALTKKAFDAVVEASSDAQVKIASMDATLKATGKSTNEIRQRILDASAAFTKLGFDDEEAAKSMAVLFQRTNDVNDAIRLTTLAADLARAKQIDLDSATKLVTLALSGQGRALMQYGINIKDSATPLEALAELQRVVGGQSEAFAKTFVGQKEVMQMAWEDFLQWIGDKFLPTLTQGLGAVVLIVISLSERISAFMDRITEFAQTTGLIDVWRAAWDSISTTFREKLQPALERLWESIQPLMPFLKALGVVIGAVLVGAIILLAEVLTRVINLFVNVLAIATNVAAFFTGVLGKSINFVTDQIANLINYVKQAVEWLGKLSLASVAGSVGSAVSSAIKGPYKIPGFAEGGTVPGAIGAPLLAVVHGGERVIPVGGKGSGGANIVVNITGNTISSGLDLRYITEQVSDQLMRDLRRVQMI